MKKAGLDPVFQDEIHNVIGVLKGTGGGPTVAFAAHSDTVFPMDTPIKVRREGDTLYAPPELETIPQVVPTCCRPFARSGMQI